MPFGTEVILFLLLVRETKSNEKGTSKEKGTEVNGTVIAVKPLCVSVCQLITWDIKQVILLLRLGVAIARINLGTVVGVTSGMASRNCARFSGSAVAWYPGRPWCNVPLKLHAHAADFLTAAMPCCRHRCARQFVLGLKLATGRSICNTVIDLKSAQQFHLFEVDARSSLCRR